MKGFKYYFGYRYIGQFDYGYIPWEYVYFDRYEDAEYALNETKENPRMQVTEIMSAVFY